MEPAPNLTEVEKAAAIARCPDNVRPLFTGWLNGTHELDGTPRVQEAVGQ